MALGTRAASASEVRAAANARGSVASRRNRKVFAAGLRYVELVTAPADVAPTRTNVGYPKPFTSPTLDIREELVEERATDFYREL
jgi:hypothetical protein